MNHTGMFTSIMTLLLMIGVCGSVLRPGQIGSTAWMGMRSIYYFAGVLISCYFLNYMTGAYSSTERHFNGLRWNHFVPLIFSVFGLIHTIVIQTTRPQISEYAPHEDADDIVFKREAPQ